MSPIKFGCQFYTWQMSGERYVGKLPHILKVVNAAGFAGIEPETCMLGAYYGDSQGLKDVLAQHDLQLGAIAFVANWSSPVETEEERREADRVFNYVKIFPGAHLVLVQLPGKDRANLRQRQENLLLCVNAVARRATDQGIACSFHPNSPLGSIFRDLEDYRRLLDGLDSRYVGFAPDTGHIARGGMDVVELFETYRSLIKHIHFKDIAAGGGASDGGAAGGEWTAMGAGTIDFPRIVTRLMDTGYTGWIMVEEESFEAETDPDAAAGKNGIYLRQSLLPIVSGD